MGKKMNYNNKSIGYTLVVYKKFIKKIYFFISNKKVPLKVLNLFKMIYLVF